MQVWSRQVITYIQPTTIHFHIGFAIEHLLYIPVSIKGDVHSFAQISSWLGCVSERGHSHETMNKIALQ